MAARKGNEPMKSTEDQTLSPVAETPTGTRKPYSAPAIESSAPLCFHEHATEVSVSRLPGELGAEEGIPRVVARWCGACGAISDKNGLAWQAPSSAPLAPSVRALQALPMSLNAQVTRWRRIELAAIATVQADVELAQVVDSPSQWSRHDYCSNKLAAALRTMLEVLGGLAVCLVVLVGCSSAAPTSAGHSALPIVQHDADVVQLGDRDAAAEQLDDVGMRDAAEQLDERDAAAEQLDDAGTVDAGGLEVDDAGTVDAGDTRAVCPDDQSVLGAACSVGHCETVCDWLGSSGFGTVCCEDTRYPGGVFHCRCGGAQ
jgi:hypothetical protein